MLCVPKASRRRRAFVGGDATLGARLKSWAPLLGALVLALALAALAAQTPRPAPVDAPESVFSAGRAMADVREIARRPHPTGSADHARVRDCLFARMTALGLSPTLQTGRLSENSGRLLARMGGDRDVATLTNLVGVLPGRDPAAPAVLVMAHYDSRPGSPGAADDTTGVAAILEAVRAIRARGQAERSLVVLLSDAEEIDLDGARLFFGSHPLKDRIGAAVNLEARGGGGRALMFQTGRQNGEMVRLYADAARRASGGPTSNSLAVFVYDLMPNGTDFTLARDAGLPGLNFAFLGRPEQYHTALSTPDALDQGALQHIGAQSLEAADALLRAQTLPKPAPNLVYADLFGLSVLAYPAAAGWIVLGIATVLALVALVRSQASVADAGRGALDGLWFVAAALVALPAIGIIAGPLEFRSGLDLYYGRLARLHEMEFAAVAILVALAALMVFGRARVGRVAWVAAVAWALALGALAGNLDFVVVACAAIALMLGALPRLAPRTSAGAGLGLLLLALGVAGLAQLMAPETAYFFAWPALLAAGAAALATVLPRRLSWTPAAAATVVGGAWLMTQGHLLFLGIGDSLPAALVLPGLLVAMLARPLAPDPYGA